MKFYASALAILMASAVSVAAGGETPSNPDAQVYIINLENGQIVSSPILVQFGLRGMGVAPAGIYMGPESPTGHHHIALAICD